MYMTLSSTTTDLAPGLVAHVSLICWLCTAYTVKMVNTLRAESIYSTQIKDHQSRKRSIKQQTMGILPAGEKDQ